MQKEIWNWIIKNFGNIFSVLGVFATLYFGLFYIPDYIEESKNAKLNNASKEVIQSIKELVYSDSILSVQEVTALILSKEVGANVEFGVSDKWFLLKAEESFMEDKFIPLNDRRKLFKKIELLVKDLPKPTNKEPIENKNKSSWVITVISFIGTLATLIFGLLSIRENYIVQKSKDEEIENELKEAQSEIGATRLSVDYIQIEKDILQILKKSKLELNSNSINKTDSEIDFEFKANKKNYFVEVKVLRRSKVGLKSIESFLLQIKDKRGIGIFIYNTELTPLSLKRLNDFNEKSKYSEIHAIKYSTKEEVEKKINEIIKKTA